MGETCSTYGEEEMCLEGFGGETWWKESLGRPRCRWEDNIKMGLQELEWWALVNTVMNFPVH